MKNIRRSIRVILEIAIACLIFFFIVVKTPLFDRAIPDRDKQNTIIRTGAIIQDTMIKGNDITDTHTESSPKQINSTIPTGVTKIIETDGNIVYIYDDASQTTTIEQKSETENIKDTTLLTYGTHTSQDNNRVIETPVKTGLSCVSPRGEKISHQETVIAYESNRANNDNICNGQTRTCRDGMLGGSYIHKNCNYIIDGKINFDDGKSVDINPGASDTNQQRVNLEDYIKKRDSIPKQYIQPIISRDNIAPTIKEIRKPMINSTIAEKKVIMNDTLDQTTIRDINNPYPYSCRTPRGTRIPHGEFIYAYNISESSIKQQCISQKRACVNGKLSGSFTYKSCNIIGERIGTITNGQGQTFYPNINRNPYSTIYNNSTIIGQNYINPITNTLQQTSCTTPRGDLINNNDTVVTYRLPTSTDNSLCDKQVRTCRDGVLGGSYTYQTCIEQTITQPSHNHHRREFWHW